MGCSSSTEEISDPRHVNLTHFCVERIIGQGSFGEVHACVHKPTYNIILLFINSGKWYALKILEKTEVVRKNSVDQVINEKNLLSELHNPFLVNMFYAFTDNECCYMILDLCLGGDLRYLLNDIF